MNKLVWVSALLLTVMMACNKAVVNFGEETLTDDPNIIYLDTLTINMGTYQADSFVTSGDTIFIAGKHKDALLGGYESKAFFQLGVPAVNRLNGCANCTYDSIAVITRFTGNYYGDTTTAFTLNVHRLNQQMIPESTSIGYNTSAFGYDELPLGSVTFNTPRPSLKESVSLKLPDVLGQELFSMLKRNVDTATTTDKFQQYFNGLVLTGKSADDKAIYYFGLNDTTVNSVMRLYYRETGSTSLSRYIDFPVSPVSYQFNAFSYNKTGSLLDAFTPAKKQVLPAAQTGNKSILHDNSGLYPYFNIPNLFALKELHPYIKVVRATLEITPPVSNYGTGSLYQLPQYMALYGISDEYAISGAIADANAEVQDGDLYVDYLYNKDTKYTYDLTAYVNNILSTGRTAGQSLILYTGSNTGESRLILDATAGQSSVKLKIYVLGL